MWSWIRGLFKGRRPKLDFGAQMVLKEEANWQRLIANWPYPLRLVPGTEATAAWFEEAAIGAREGFWPILITPNTAAIKALEPNGPNLADWDGQSPVAVEEIRFNPHEAKLFDLGDRPPDGYREAAPARAAAALEAMAEYSNGGAADDDGDDDPFAGLREVPPPPVETEPRAEPFYCIKSFWKDAPFPEVAITRLPTRDSWHAPLLLNFGDWNACPEPATLAAFAQRWKQLHGADIAAVTQDTLEFVVARPPATFEEATRLAKEHYMAGNDFGDIDMSEYIAYLRSAHRWFFWWD